MLPAVMYVVLSCMIVVLFFLLGRASVFDKVLLLNSFATNVSVLVVLIGLITENPTFIDVALTYACLNFIATIAFMKFFLKDWTNK